MVIRRLTAIRAVIAYPPFIFVDAATSAFGGARYEPSFRPSGGAACSANNEMIRFIIPGNENTVTEVKPKAKPQG